MNLTDPQILRPFLARHGLRAEKGLGQHFLCSSRVVDEMLGRLEGIRGILEIGPGPGVLTGPMSERADRLIALEIDAKMPAALAESAPKADVRQIDALEANLAAILDELPTPRAVVSNLPYYITGPLIDRIEAVRDQFEVAILMMQSEVAHRILAKPGNRERGAISVLLQARFDVSLVCKVPGSAFLPPPKVESAVLALRPRPGGFESADARRIIRMAFAQPRKTLGNNLAAGQIVARDSLPSVLASAGLDASIRPHELRDEQWAALLAAILGDPCP